MIAADEFIRIREDLLAKYVKLKLIDTGSASPRSK
jgi:hypothetical protein